MGINNFELMKYGCSTHNLNLTLDIIFKHYIGRKSLLNTIIPFREIIMNRINSIRPSVHSGHVPHIINLTGISIFVHSKGGKNESRYMQRQISA